ncbi:MAG TPA: hypothetical protein VKQ32_29645 [Polyangia bacterium]|nr:hypothetical protein [Polyangia bacterium]
MKMLEPPDLDADMRAVIDAARGGHEPNEMARARVRRGVEVKLAAGLALAVAPTASAFASAAKVTVAVVAIGTAVGAGVYVYPRLSARPAPAHPTAQHVAARPARIEMPAPAEIPAPAPAPARPHVKHHAAVAAPPVAVENVSSLKEETALLGAANAALARGEVKRALSLLDDYDHRPGAAQLAEERTVTGILASCAAGHIDAARAEARHFHARWPRSPLAARVDGSCAGSGGSGPAHSVP